jgi:hypothetical protein
MTTTPVAAPTCAPATAIGPDEILEDMPFLLGLCADLTGQPPEVVRSRLLQELRSLGTNVREALAEWNLRPHEWSDRLAEFYEQTDAFVYETLCWNLCGAKRQMREQVVRFLGQVHPRGGVETGSLLASAARLVPAPRHPRRRRPAASRARGSSRASIRTRWSEILNLDPEGACSGGGREQDYCVNHERTRPEHSAARQ